MDFQKYRGQWGGKIEAKDGSVEEMWWSEPNEALRKGSRYRRLRFMLDTRQYFLMKYLRSGIEESRARGVRDPKVIDFGCGTGGTTLNFSAMIGERIDGYDLFPTQIEIANEHAKKIGSLSQFHVLNKDGTFPLADESVDVIFSADVLGHVPSIPETLKEWHRILKKGGTIALFTESNYSGGDQSLMARLARNGLDMTAGVPEHISLVSREELEAEFQKVGFKSLERISANTFHWFFFPKDYVLLYQRHFRTDRNSDLNPSSVPTQKAPMKWVYWVSLIWNKLMKVFPFYPVPHETFRLGLTKFFGKNAYGTSYFYCLKKTE